MYYVYLLKSIDDSVKYIGFTSDLKQRFKDHNSGKSVYAGHRGPWKLISYIAFDAEDKARDFEKYIKIGSGHAFAKRHFW